MIKDGIKVGEFLDFWLEEIMKGSVRHSTFVSYRGYVENHAKFFLKEIPLMDIKTVHIQELVARLSKRAQIGPRTIGIVVRMLNNAFSYAEDYEIIIKNPCRRIRLPRVEEKELEIFDNTEQTRIERAVLKSKDKRHYGLLLSLYTGMRIGEVCALRWDNVDLSNKCVYVKKQLNRVATNGRLKTVVAECEPKTRKSKRTIILPEFIVKILRKLKEESSSNYVFSMRSGKFVQPRTMQNLHKNLLKQAGVKHNKFHVMRHTFATRAAEINTDPKTVSEILGHSSTSITLNRYTHSLREQKAKLMRGLNSYFSEKKVSSLLQPVLDQPLPPVED